MDASTAAAMQMQVRQNAEDLQDFMKGLESWEEEIKEKDQNLSRQKPILKEVGEKSTEPLLYGAQSPVATPQRGSASVSHSLTHPQKQNMRIRSM